MSSTTPPPVSSTPAGWYPDPDGSGGQRYWDGSTWTTHRAPGTAPALSAAKKPFWRRGWFIAVLAVLVVIIGLSTASGRNDNSGSATGSSRSSSSSGNSDTGVAAPEGSKPSLNADTGMSNRVDVGSSFVLGDFKILNGWRVHKLGYGMGYEVKNLEVQNLTDADHTFSVDIKLHKGPHRIVADISCIANEAHAKDIVNVDCLPDGSGKPYDYVTIENSF